MCSTGSSTRTPGARQGWSQAFPKTLQANDLARHVECLGFREAGGDELARAASSGALRSRSIDAQARRVRTIDGARAEALVHREGVGEVALGVAPATEAGGEHAAIEQVRSLARDDHGERLHLRSDGTHLLVKRRRCGSVLESLTTSLSGEPPHGSAKEKSQRRADDLEQRKELRDQRLEDKAQKREEQMEPR
jgi:hypothetical protein